MRRFLPIAIAFLIAAQALCAEPRIFILAPTAKSQPFKTAELQRQPEPLNTPTTAAMVELGRKLFFDKSLSQGGTVACATCHDPKLGWADGLPLAVGIGGRVGTRHTPTIINAGYSALMFHDGRTVGTTTQALLPLSNPIEMGQQSEAEILIKLRLNADYTRTFADVFGVDVRTQSPITFKNLGTAIAAFETSIVSVDAPVHRRLRGDMTALSADGEIGFKLFMSSGCTDCHVPPLFTDNLFHNNGMEYVARASGQRFDLGRFIVSRQERDRRSFKTPTLAEIQRTAPYSHVGTFDDVKAVVAHYGRGGAQADGRRDPLIDRRVSAIKLNETQQAYLVKFLSEGFRSSKYPMVEAP